MADTELNPLAAAVRLARDADISRSSPRLFSVVGDNVSLSQLILKRVVGAYARIGRRYEDCYREAYYSAP